MVDKPDAAAEQPRIQVGTSTDRSFSTDVGSKVAAEIESDATVAEFDQGEVTVKSGDETPEAEPDAGAETGEASGDDETGDEGDSTDLGEWDKDNEEVRSKFDQHYFSEDGQLNADVISAEFWAGATADQPGSLKPATYAYLQDTLGISREFIKQVEDGLVASNEKAATAFYGRVGGKERYEAAINWAKDGGYTQEQRERFNTLRTKGGEDFNDAVDALMARFEKSAGAPKDTGRRGPPSRRPSTPARDVTGGAQSAGTGPQGYKDYVSYQAAQKDAMRSGDPKKQKEVREKLRASAFYNKK